MHTKIVSADHFRSLRGEAEVLERDSFGEKVLRVADGTILKLFRRKRLVSSALWYPYAERFVDNAAHLKAVGIIAPDVIALYRVPEISRDVVHYVPVPGITLRHYLKQHPGPGNELRDQVTRYILLLFSKGIYFRSLHLGNIVLQPDGSFALIDIADLRHQSGPLSAYMRRRSVARITKIAEPSELRWIDVEILLQAEERTHD